MISSRLSEAVLGCNCVFIVAHSYARLNVSVLVYSFFLLFFHLYKQQSAFFASFCLLLLGLSVHLLLPLQLCASPFTVTMS